MKPNMPVQINESLFGSWRHSHEEDSAKSMVFRRLDYAFPPSRGRMVFELDAHFHGVFHPIGRDDRTLSLPCNWELTYDHRLSLRDSETGDVLLQGVLQDWNKDRLELRLS